MSAQPPDGPPADSGSGDERSAAEVAPATFDPYRFGPPAHPIDPAYAPPGYVPPPAAPAPPAPPVGGGQQFPGGFGSYPPAGYQPPANYPANFSQSDYQQPGYQQPGYPQPGYPQPGYQQPGYPPYGYAPPNPYGANARNGLAVTALVLGIVGLVFSWVPFFDALVFIPGIVFGFVGLSSAKRRGGVGRAMAIAGLVLSVVAAAICVSFSVYIATRINCTTVHDGLGNQSSHCTVDDNG